jgi:hypothetical protein
MYAYISSMLGHSTAGPIKPTAMADFTEDAGPFAVLGCVK